MRSPHCARTPGQSRDSGTRGGRRASRLRGPVAQRRARVHDLACCVGKMERCDPSPSASGSSPGLIPAVSRVSRALSAFRGTRSTRRLCSLPHLRPRAPLPLAPFLPPPSVPPTGLSGACLERPPSPPPRAPVAPRALPTPIRVHPAPGRGSGSLPAGEPLEGLHGAGTCFASLGPGAGTGPRELNKPKSGPQIRQ